ncbi:uncharacterized protein N7529_004058 [Penicillium soppii]|uniref:uncharacterized protein n=1 Tax=Penicillium soppii TaxID=69789 RepID=UPI0025474C00|nr:uncharacterized protein N7529_004058 [Penicillium soppii]KAJ5871705.1 hypothetical protein N7529_004058 [Penicillium soppii]
MSQESLSPTVSSAGFSTFAEAKLCMEATLASYQALNTGDDTKKFLETCFKYLPPAGQVNLSEDVSGCRNDDELRQLAASIDTGLLRPLLSKGGKTPVITPSPRTGFDNSAENLNSLDITPASRNDQGRLRRNCLRRDGYRCTITKSWSSYHDFPVGEPTGILQAVHILPFALGSFTNDDERRRTSEVWVNIFRYFPSLRSTLDMSPEDVNREDNIMMMLTPLHEEFGLFHFVLEDTPTLDRYRLKLFPRFASIYTSLLPRDRVITLTSHDPLFHLPRAEHLQLHAAIGNILHASGRAESIEKLIRDLGETGGSALSKDGSTNISDLLSVSHLSLLASNSRPTDSKVQQQRARARLPGTENEKPKLG